MTWTELTTEEQFEKIKEQSAIQPVVIFKHSTRCSISAMAKGRVEKIGENGNTLFYHLDLLKHRLISNKVAEDYHVHHASPQVLLVVNGECVYEESHNGITAQELEEEIANAGKASLN